MLTVGEMSEAVSSGEGQPTFGCLRLRHTKIAAQSSLTSVTTIVTALVTYL